MFPSTTRCSRKLRVRWVSPFQQCAAHALTETASSKLGLHSAWCSGVAQGWHAWCWPDTCWRCHMLTLPLAAADSPPPAAFYWYLYQDGSIGYDIKLTGELSTNLVSPGGQGQAGGGWRVVAAAGLRSVSSGAPMSCRLIASVGELSASNSFNWLQGRTPPSRRGARWWRPASTRRWAPDWHAGLALGCLTSNTK